MFYLHRFNSSETQADYESCKLQLERAITIIGGLGGEKTRWTEAAARLGEIYQSLTGNVLIASGVVAYLGPFTSDFRADQISKWTAKCNSLGVHCDE